MKWDNLEALLQKYYDGETSTAEEKELRDFFNSTPLLPDYLKPHAAQFKYYNQQQEVELDKYLADDWLFEKIEAEVVAPAKMEVTDKKEEARHYTIKLPAVVQYWRVAASISLLLVAFWAGNHYRERMAGGQSTDMVALQQEIREMKQVLAASSSASDRIRVVSQDFSAVETEDEEVIDLLIRTLNHDPNVNVRLAACEGLYQFKNNKKVRAAFIQALEKQTDPLVQITLIDILIGLKEKKAVEPLKELTEKENLLPAVKQKAQQGIGTLI